MCELRHQSGSSTADLNGAADSAEKPRWQPRCP